MPDSSIPSIISTISFGSCYNSYKNPPTSPWPYISSHNPDLFVWTGDAVYANSNSLESLVSAYKEVSNEYVTFEKTHEIIGTWDDHDYGVNDGGYRVEDKEKRRDLFLDFLQVDSKERRNRLGVYASHDFGTGNESVRVILMDSRYDRSDHVIPSVGHLFAGTFIGKFTALVAATIRLFAAWSGLILYGDNQRHILSQEQWNWLEFQLKTSKASVNVLVSSIQVLTTNPSMESWGHFPSERRKLLNLVKRYEPKGFMILSGDVHVGAFLEAGGLFPVEITSSGLSHSCSDSLPLFFCRLAWEGRFSNENNAKYRNVFLERNYGVIKLDWNERRINLGVYNIPNSAKEKSEEKLHFSRLMDSKFTDLFPEPWIEPKGILLDDIGSILMFWSGLFAVVLFGVFIMFRLMGLKKGDKFIKI